MQFSTTFSSAFQVLRSNKLRTSLTLASVGIGVFSIISVMTAIGVFQNSIESGLSQLGANTFQVQKYPQMQHGPGDRERFRNRRNITWRQAQGVAAQSREALTVGIEAWHFGEVVQWGNKKTDPNTSVAGENPEGFPTNHWEIEYGRAIAQSDLDLSRNVVVLGYDLAAAIFPPSLDPIGKSVRMGGRDYTVIGTMKSRGGMFGNQDRYFIIPITTFFEYYGANRSVNIMVQARSRENFDACLDEVIGILRSERNLRPWEENDFETFSNESVISNFNDLTRYVRLGTFAIAAVALLAAGIGIMNIMLVSVTERTKEIGTRKAVGATRQAIVVQFLSEALLLTLFGGITGILAGLLAGNTLAVVMDIPPIIQIEWVAVGVVACLVIGIIFGTYPAWKAASLDPIEALRYE